VVGTWRVGGGGESSEGGQGRGEERGAHDGIVTDQLHTWVGPIQHVPRRRKEKGEGGDRRGVPSGDKAQGARGGDLGGWVGVGRRREGFVEEGRKEGGREGGGEQQHARVHIMNATSNALRQEERYSCLFVPAAAEQQTTLTCHCCHTPPPQPATYTPTRQTPPTHSPPNDAWPHWPHTPSGYSAAPPAHLRGASRACVLLP
jgi:hypothetical protein